MTKPQIEGVESVIDGLNYLLTDKRHSPLESTQIIQAISSLTYATHSGRDAPMREYQHCASCHGFTRHITRAIGGQWCVKCWNIDKLGWETLKLWIWATERVCSRGRRHNHALHQGNQV
jgi:hypothetical protein